MASKYERLGAYLRAQGRSLVPMTFAEIERVVGFKLPKSQRHQAWWSNSISNNVMTQVWLDAGYRTEQVDIGARKLVFRRVSDVAPKTRESGMSDTARDFESEKADEKKGDRHPLFGAMKGTFALVPPGDDEPPPEDPKSWEALTVAKLDRLLFGKGE